MSLSTTALIPSPTASTGRPGVGRNSSTRARISIALTVSYRLRIAPAMVAKSLQLVLREFVRLNRVLNGLVICRCLRPWRRATIRSERSADPFRRLAKTWRHIRRLTAEDGCGRSVPDNR